MNGGASLSYPELPAGVPVPPPCDERPWHAGWAVPIAVGALVVGIVVFALASGIRDGLTDAPIHRPGTAGVAVHGAPPVLTVLSTLAQDLALVVGVWLAVAASFGGRVRVAALGLRPTRLGRSAGYVAGAYVVFLLVSAGWATLMDLSDRENLPVSLGTRDSVGALIASMLLVCAVAPLAEELFFRGFVFGALRRRGLPLAAGVSGVLFGLAHVASSPIGFIVPLAVLGVLLCLVYERTGSLYPPIALHCVNNSIAFGVGDGRGWLVPVCLAVGGTAIVLVLRAVVRSYRAPRPGPSPATA